MDWLRLVGGDKAPFARAVACSRRARCAAKKTALSAGRGVFGQRMNLVKEDVDVNRKSPAPGMRAHVIYMHPHTG